MYWWLRMVRLTPVPCIASLSSEVHATMNSLGPSLPTRTPRSHLLWTPSVGAMVCRYAVPGGGERDSNPSSNMTLPLDPALPPVDNAAPPAIDVPLHGPNLCRSDQC